uniref:Uncharacterized protein n=1 Tax=Anguilla anguilla TaxID=7936 RepID=A0A0E9XL53_ANGAN
MAVVDVEVSLNFVHPCMFLLIFLPHKHLYFYIGSV